MVHDTKCEEHARHIMSGLNAQVALAGMTLSKAQLQLLNKTEREVRKKEKILALCQMACVVTHAVFVEEIEHATREKELLEVAKRG